MTVSSLWLTVMLIRFLRIESVRSMRKGKGVITVIQVINNGRDSHLHSRKDAGTCGVRASAVRTETARFLSVAKNHYRYLYLSKFTYPSDFPIHSLINVTKASIIEYFRDIPYIAFLPI
jgi:hypothetical protein